MNSAIIGKIAKQYLESNDFNGFPTQILTNEYKWSDIRNIVKENVEKGVIDVIFGDYHPNPHIKAFNVDPIEEQISKIDKEIFEYSCLYPSKKYLSDVVNRQSYKDAPFRLFLALGEPQLEYKAFDLSILEIYRNDPRYYYENDDINGRICIADEYYQNESIKESDQILLQTFGFCYDQELNRYVSVYLRYLYQLSSEHQKIWESRLVNYPTQIHPDYHRTSLGYLPDGISIFSAFLEEQRVINEMVRRIGKPKNFFKVTYTDLQKPREFSFLVRPTLREYSDFILLLDKLISDNINKDFFMNEVPYEDEHVRDDGKILVTNRGSLRIFEEWIKKFFQTDEHEVVNHMIKTFKKIRTLRQKPAHAIKENEFDNKYIYEQREIMNEAYKALRTLRLIFENHPFAKDVKVSEPVQEGKIWSI